jgi:inhibitor of KinA sporulation pathway (predicted exonuclease)
MAKMLNTILVIDVEATCWSNNPPPGEQAEIIEIGYAILDVPKGHIRRNGTILVKPERSKVSAFCTELTTLTQVQVDQGIAFTEACQFLEMELDAQSATWASYGVYDRKQFARQCQSFDVPYPLSDTHLNIKNLFALVHGLPREIGMAKALELMQREVHGTHHRALDDAQNIAHILAHLISPIKTSSRR